MCETLTLWCDDDQEAKSAISFDALSSRSCPGRCPAAHDVSRRGGQSGGATGPRRRFSAAATHQIRCCATGAGGAARLPLLPVAASDPVSRNPLRSGGATGVASVRSCLGAPPLFNPASPGGRGDSANGRKDNGGRGWRREHVTGREWGLVGCEGGIKNLPWKSRKNHAQGPQQGWSNGGR